VISSSFVIQIDVCRNTDIILTTYLDQGMPIFLSILSHVMRLKSRITRGNSATVSQLLPHPGSRSLGSTGQFPIDQYLRHLCSQVFGHERVYSSFLVSHHLVDGQIDPLPSGNILTLFDFSFLYMVFTI
jgi:hypothetical protein